MSSSILPTYNRAPLAFDKGQGSWLFTKDGDCYLDMGAGIAVNALGHSNPELVEALTFQASKLWHISNLYEIQVIRSHPFGQIPSVLDGYPYFWWPDTLHIKRFGLCFSAGGIHSVS